MRTGSCRRWKTLLTGWTHSRNPHDAPAAAECWGTRLFRHLWSFLCNSQIDLWKCFQSSVGNVKALFLSIILYPKSNFAFLITLNYVFISWHAQKMTALIWVMRVNGWKCLWCQVTSLEPQSSQVLLDSFEEWRNQISANYNPFGSNQWGIIQHSYKVQLRAKNYFALPWDRCKSMAGPEELRFCVCWASCRPGIHSNFSLEL